MTSPVPSAGPDTTTGTVHTGRARRVLNRKRAVVRDSLSVVRTTWNTLRHDRFLVRTLGGIAVGSLVALVVWKLASKASDDHARFRPLMIAIRLTLMLCVQYIVAAGLYAHWSGDPQARGRHMWKRLTPRLPAFLMWAIVLAWLEYATQTSTFATLIRTGASFALGYALSYAVPAAAVYRTGMFRAFQRSYQAFRVTFGADLFAWSGVWLVTGFVALLTAIPEIFDLYLPGSPGSPPRAGFVGRLIGWALAIPVSVAALAISAGFCTVIFFALTRNYAPTDYSKHTVETVCGLQLDDN
ncbi:hypothetical protein BH10ACT2_BH10ACT2_10510 [soil metagenome]